MANTNKELCRIISMSYRDLENECALIEEELETTGNRICKFYDRDREMVLNGTDKNKIEVIEGEIGVLEKYKEHLQARRSFLISVMNEIDEHKGFYFIKNF